MRGAIKVEHGNGVWIYDNHWMTGKGIDAPGVFADPGTVQRLFIAANQVQ